MVDPAPYIVIDNQVILPVVQTPPSGSAGGGPESPAQQDFGVVDRVTISSQARQKFRQAQFDTASPPGPAMLTYTPEKLR